MERMVIAAVFLAGLLAGAMVTATAIIDGYDGFKIPDAVERERPLVLAGEPWANGARHDGGLPPYNVSLNGDGIRDEPVPETKTRTRILVLGDGRTYGPGMAEEDRFTERLQGRLNRDGSYRVINAGIPEAGLVDMERFYQEVGRTYRPDIVVVDFNAFSDVSWLEHRRRSNISDGIGRAIPLIDGDLVAAALHDGYVDHYTGAPEIRRYTRDIARMARADGARPIFLMVTPSHPPAIEAGMRRWVTDGLDAAYIGPPAEFRQDTLTYVVPNTYYLSAGHRVIADLLYQEITGR